MRFLWTTNDAVGSRLIRWGLKEDCSHFAVEIAFPHRTVILDSTGHTGGVRTRTPEEFFAVNRIVHALSASLSSADEGAFYDAFYRQVGTPYDFKAILFWAVAAAGKRLVGMPLPTENRWGSRRESYCVEVLTGAQELVKRVLHVDLSGVDIEMLSPHQAYTLLKESPKLVE